MSEHTANDPVTPEVTLAASTEATKTMVREATLRVACVELASALATFVSGAFLTHGGHRNMRLGEALAQFEIWIAKVREALK